MAEELDQAEVAEASPEPEVAPEPAVESEPQPEFTYEPEFLKDQPEPAPQPAPQPQQWTPEQVAYYNQQQRMAQQPQAPQESTLDRLVRDTDGTIGGIAEQRAMQVANQMMQQNLNPMANQMNTFIQGQAEYQAAGADGTITQMYDTVFTKDEAFASDKRIQDSVDNAIAGLREQAIYQARQGNPNGFAIFSKPFFAKGILALAREMHGYSPASAGTGTVPHVESGVPPTQQQNVELDADTEAVLSRYGDSNMRERYIQGLKDADKYGDFQG